MADGYEDYIAVGRSDSVEHVACWAHVRHVFVEAVKVQGKRKQGRALAYLDKLTRYTERDNLPIDNNHCETPAPPLWLAERTSCSSTRLSACRPLR